MTLPLCSRGWPSCETGIIIVHNKGQAMPARDIQIALARKQDWMTRTQV